MNTDTKSKQIVCANKMNYSVVYSHTPTERCYGICITSTEDESYTACAPNLFFTEDEAIAYCKHFARNKVYPISLIDVLENIFILH